MKRFLSLITALCICLGAMPALAALPYEVVSEFANESVTGITVKKTDTCKDDFTLYAAYGDGDYIYDVKRVDSESLAENGTISFDTVEGAEIELFAWDDDMVPVEDLLGDMDYATVMSQLKKVNDYYISEHNTIYAETNPWDVAVFHTGNMQAYYMTGDELYRNYSEKWSKAHLWQSYGYPVWSGTNADNICCFRTYIDLYNMGVEGADLSYVQNQVDTIVNSYSNAHWDWIDAFYMAAPTFVRMYELTGEEKYLDKMYEMIKYTAEELNLYDEEDGLWYRDTRFINQLSDNGKKIFWSRGDGWVYAAFAQIIEELPDSYAHKDYFVDIFLEMSKALKKAQCEKGAWHESLLDPDYNPDCEESGTGFFTYGMLWGINNGYLDEKEYLTTALKGWKWLTEVALREDGHIGYVQYIGSYPTEDKLTMNNTEDYAYATFAFAASEMAKYLGGMQGDVLPYLQKKLLGNIEVYKKGSSYAIKNGVITACEIDCDRIEEYVGEGMYLYESGDLLIISEYITPFNRTETSLLAVLSDILDKGEFPERAYSDPERIEIVIHESVKPARGEGAVYTSTVSQPSVVTAEKIELTAENITMSNMVQADNGPANALDGSLGTWMALQVPDDETPEYIDIDLGDEYTISHIGMAFRLGNQRKSYFSVSVSGDGVNYEEVIPLSYSSGDTELMAYYAIDSVKARYVRIYGYGNSSVNAYTWFSVTELAIYQSLEESLPVSAVDASLAGLVAAEFTAVASIETESQNHAGNVNDDDENSYCVLYVEKRNNPQYIEFNLGEVKDIGYVALAFRNGSRRQTAFRIDISEDGEDFTNAVPKSFSTGETEDYEYYPINAKAQYIRVYGYYNTVYNPYWVSITEARVYVAE